MTWPFLSGLPSTALGSPYFLQARLFGGVDEEEDDAATICWALAETAINDNARRMVGMEGHVGQRGERRGPAML